MSILTLGSNNPEFSFVLSKNPTTIRDSNIPWKKELRKGHVSGWFLNSNQAFRLWFKDDPLHCSFAEGRYAEFEYLDRTRYASPYLPISIITNCLSTPFKQNQDNDREGFKSWLETTVEIRSNSMLAHLVKHFNVENSGFHIHTEHLSGHAYIIRLEATSIHKLLNLAMVVFLMICMSTKGLYVDLKGEIVRKYIAAINAINAPYFVRYLFKRNVFSNRETFNKNKELLDTIDIDLTHGDTLTQRKAEIVPLLRGGQTLVDIGCGELHYAIPLSGKYEQILAFEADPEIREDAIRKVKGRGVENIIVEGICNQEAIDTFDTYFDGADVLITEVLEHMPKQESAMLLKGVLGTKFRKVIVTVPNKDFNIHYLIAEDGFRHDDHKWEPKEEEFRTWVSAIVGDDFDLTVSGIGDAVNGTSTSLMAVISPKA